MVEKKEKEREVYYSLVTKNKCLSQNFKMSQLLNMFFKKDFIDFVMILLLLYVLDILTLRQMGS